MTVNTFDAKAYSRSLQAVHQAKPEGETEWHDIRTKTTNTAAADIAESLVHVCAAAISGGGNGKPLKIDAELLTDVRSSVASLIKNKANKLSAEDKKALESALGDVTKLVEFGKAKNPQKFFEKNSKQLSALGSKIGAMVNEQKKHIEGEGGAIGETMGAHFSNLESLLSGGLALPASGGAGEEKKPVDGASKSAASGSTQHFDPKVMEEDIQARLTKAVKTTEGLAGLAQSKGQYQEHADTLNTLSKQLSDMAERSMKSES